MADYTIIADVSEKMAGLLQEQLVPDMVSGADKIALCSPADKADVSLGIFLFDIRESEEIRRSSMVSYGVNAIQYPPIYLNLYYMITAYTVGEVRYKMAAEQRLLGRVIQYFHDYPLIPIDDVSREDMTRCGFTCGNVKTDSRTESKNMEFPKYSVQNFHFLQGSTSIHRFCTNP